MAKNETGEFELVLGNRQLLSGFAVVAILFGVFFAMGYIVGRNSTPSARLQGLEGQPPAPVATSAAGQPDPGRAATRTPAAEQPATDPAPASSDPTAQPAETPQPTTQAARPPEAARSPEK